MKILVVCGAGMGTSVMMKIKLEQFINENNLDASVESCAIDGVELSGVDILLCTPHLIDELGHIPDSVHLIKVPNLMDIQGYGNKIIDYMNR